jgi:hypothetical protein
MFPFRTRKAAPQKRRDISGRVITGPAAALVWWSRDETYPAKDRARSRAANKAARRSRRVNRQAAR